MTMHRTALCAIAIAFAATGASGQVAGAAQETAAARDSAVAAADSPSRTKRVAALTQLWRTPDRRALPALVRLTERSFADVEEREEAWEQLAQVTSAIAPEVEIPQELESFLLRIEKQKPQLMFLDRRTLDHPGERPRYDYAQAARNAIGAIELARARRQLDAELAALPSDQRAAHVADAAWSAKATGPRPEAARTLLRSLGKAGVQATRARIDRASPDAQIWMVEFAEASLSVDPAGATSALLELADEDASMVYDAALGVLMRHRPSNAAARLANSLEKRSEPRRMRIGLETLGMLGDPAALPLLRTQFRSADPETSIAAARGLALVGPGGVAFLAAEVARDGPSQRAAALGLFEVKSDPAARKALADVATQIRDPDLRELIEREIQR